MVDKYGTGTSWLWVIANKVILLLNDSQCMFPTSLKKNPIGILKILFWY